MIVHDFLGAAFTSFQGAVSFPKIKGLVVRASGQVRKKYSRAGEGWDREHDPRNVGWFGRRTRSPLLVRGTERKPGA